MSTTDWQKQQWKSPYLKINKLTERRGRKKDYEDYDYNYEYCAYCLTNNRVSKIVHYVLERKLEGGWIRHPGKFSCCSCPDCPYYFNLDNQEMFRNPFYSEEKRFVRL